MIFCSVNGLKIVKARSESLAIKQNSVVACLLENELNVALISLQLQARDLGVLAQSDPCLLTKTKLLYANVSMILVRYGLS